MLRHGYGDFCIGNIIEDFMKEVLEQEASVLNHKEMRLKELLWNYCNN